MNIFISALIALFFLNKSSKDVQEKTKRASKFRTFVYFVLAFITGVMFYKSYQVATVNNSVDFRVLRGAVDSLGHPKDTIECLYVFNKINCAGSYNNPFVEPNSFADSLLTKEGGVWISLKVVSAPTDTIKEFSDYTLELEQSLNEQLGADVSQMGQLYRLISMSNSIPSFIPIYPKINKIERWEHLTNCYDSISSGNTRDIKNSICIENSKGSKTRFFDQSRNHRKMTENGLIIDHFMLFDHISEDSIEYVWGNHNPYVNTMGWMTGADVSQYTFVLSLPFQEHVYIKKIRVIYNLPIEVNCPEEGLSSSFRFIDLDENFMKDYQHGSLQFYVKLPTMANIQQIRSIIITALVTTFVSLFFTNFFYCFRRWAMKYRRKHGLKYGEKKRLCRKRVDIFKNFHYLVAILFCILLLCCAILFLFDTTILVKDDFNAYEIIGIIIGFVAISLFITNLLYKYAITPIPKKRGKEKIKAKQAKQEKEN